MDGLKWFQVMPRHDDYAKDAREAEEVLNDKMDLYMSTDVGKRLYNEFLHMLVLASLTGDIHSMSAEVGTQFGNEFVVACESELANRTN